MKNTLFFTTLLLFAGYRLSAQDGPSAEELAIQLSNPVASLISVPFQNNSDFGIGDLEGSRNTLNIQPVVPVSLAPKLNLIARWVQPVITQYNITGVGNRESGVADPVVSGFISPKDSKNGFTWGAGPALLLPIGSDDFTIDEFGVGPTAVALKQSNGCTYGGLINQIWAGDLSQMFLQPFLVYNWKSGAGANIEWTQNWTAYQAVVWFNPTISGLTSMGKQKVSFVVGPRINLAAPDAARADWGGRAVATLVMTRPTSILVGRILQPKFFL